MAHREFVRLGLFKKTLSFEFTHDELSRFKTILAAIPRNPIARFPACEKRVRVDSRIRIEDADLIQAESFPDFEIIEIMPRRDLQGSATEGAINVSIGDDRHNSSSDRQPNFLADPTLITLVLRMDCDRSIAEHCFRARGRDHKVLRRIISQRITNMPQSSVCILVHDFDIGERGLAARAPIDQPLSTIKKPVLPELDERFPHRVREPFVHRKAFVAPVAGNPERFQLMQNRIARFAFPIPDGLNELFPP